MQGEDAVRRHCVDCDSDADLEPQKEHPAYKRVCLNGNESKEDDQARECAEATSSELAATANLCCGDERRVREPTGSLTQRRRPNCATQYCMHTRYLPSYRQHSYQHAAHDSHLFLVEVRQLPLHMCGVLVLGADGTAACVGVGGAP